jgi:anti-sigma B factor antagonist
MGSSGGAATRPRCRTERRRPRRRPASTPAWPATVRIDACLRPSDTPISCGNWRSGESVEEGASGGRSGSYRRSPSEQASRSARSAVDRESAKIDRSKANRRARPGRYVATVLSSEIRAVEGCTVLELAGAFDAESASRIRQTLTDLIDATAGPIVVDIGAVITIDNDGLGVLVGADHRLQARADRLRLARPQPEVRQVMHTTGMERVLAVYDTVEEACAGLP